jgi:ATP-dependent DNA ligase
VIDGELVAMNEDGLPSFNLLQNSGGAEHTILFYAFDLLILAGTDLRSRPLGQRRALLPEVIPTLGDPIRHSETFDIRSRKFWQPSASTASKASSRSAARAPTVPANASGDWVKLRVNRSQEFVIGGYMPGSNTFDAMLIGYYEGSDFRYAARIRSGFVPRTQRGSQLIQLLCRLCSKASGPHREQSVSFLEAAI